MKWYRNILMATLTAGMVYSLCSCSASPSADTVADTNTSVDSVPSQAKADETKVLRVAGESWQVSKIYLEDAAKAFMEDHPDVKVEIIT